MTQASNKDSTSTIFNRNVNYHFVVELLDGMRALRC
jgi:hypothetical protein